MIFVTASTHEQQFNRLIRAVDELVEEGTIKEEVVIQKGFSDYEPKHCRYFDVLNYKTYNKFMKEADIIICQGAPASFMSALEYGKTPIVMPRLKEFGEHVNNHQDIFSREVERRYGNIIVVSNKDQLREKIMLVKKDKTDRKAPKSNNMIFNKLLQKTIKDLL